MLASQMEDVISLVTLRIFAKKKKGQISQSDFDLLADFGINRAVKIVSSKNDVKHLEEMVIEEVRKALELISKKSCGTCKGKGLSRQMGTNLEACHCIHMVHYRGDTVLPVGEQYSNAYFTDDHNAFLSKQSLGSNDVVKNIAMAVTMFIM